MADVNLARKLLNKLRQVPKPTPIKLLAEFKRLSAPKEASTKAKHQPDSGRGVNPL